MSYELVLWHPDGTNPEKVKVLDDLIINLGKLIPNLDEQNKRMTAMTILGCQLKMTKHRSIDAEVFLATLVKTLNENPFSIGFLVAWQEAYVKGFSHDS
jgi:hypothetical protein